MKKLISIVFALINLLCFSQVGIGTSNPNPNAILELNSTSQGLKFPRLTTLQRNNIALPAKGLTVFDTEINRLMTNFGTPTVPSWKCLGSLPILNQLSVASSAAYSLRLLNSNYNGSCIKVRRNSDNNEINIDFLNGILNTKDLLNFTNIPNLIDEVTGVKAAFSVRLIRAGYTGPCVRVRRSSDNAEQDIGFINGELDKVSLQSFSGTNSAFVVIIYDQSGNSLNAIQSSPNLQARIVNAGVIEMINSKPAINFSPSGTITGYKINFNNSTLSDWTISTVLQPTNGTYLSQLPILFDTQTTRLSIQQFNTSSLGPSFGNTSGIVNGTISGSTNPISIIGTISNTTASVWQNGTLVATGNSNKCGIPSFATLGCMYTFSTYFFKGKMSEVLIYPSALSTNNKQNVEASQNAYYGLQMAAASQANSYVSTWFDQSGNSRDLIQSTTTAQPRIVNLGVIETVQNKPSVYFDGVTSHLFRNQAFIYSQGNASILSVLKAGTNASKFMLGEGNSTTNTPYYSLIYANGSNNSGVFYRNSANSLITPTQTILFPSVFNNTLQIYAVEDTGTKFKGILNGIEGSTVNYPGRSTTDLNIFSIGAVKRTDVQNYFNGNISELIIAPLLASSERQKVQVNQSVFYNPQSTPTAPSLLNASARNGEVALSWTAPLSSILGSSITDYKIEYKKASDEIWTLLNDAISIDTNIIVPGLINNTLYNFRVSAINIFGAGQLSSIVNSTPLNIVYIPTAPLNISYTRTNGQIILSWTTPISNGGEAISDFVIEFKLTNSSTWSILNDGVSNNLSTTISSLIDTTSYDFRVSATNSAGTSSPSSVLNVLSLLPAPDYLVLSPGNSKILAQWSSVANATSYKLEYRILGTTNWSSFTTQNANQRGYEINGLTNGTQYEIRVSCLYTNIFSAVSIIKVATPNISESTLINNQILSSGQSLSIGVSGGNALTTFQIYNNKMLQLNSGFNLNGNDTIFTESTFTSLIPLKEPNTNSYSGVEETPSSAMANMMSSLASPNSFNTIFSLHGIGAKSYAELKKGGTTSSYSNGQIQAKTAFNFSLLDSKGYKIRATTIIHGERDQAISTPVATYEANLVEWQANYEDDAKQLTGQSEDVPMFINQNSSWTGYNFTTPTIAIAQLNAIRNNPNKIYMTTPYYIFDYVDHAHIKNWGYRRAGEYFGKVMKKVLIDNLDWKPVMPIKVVRSANIIEARFHVPVAPLIFDTNAVVSKLNYGFEYFDSTSSASITNIEIVGGDIVRITLNNTPTGTSQKLRYAYTGTNGDKGSRLTTAPSGNLRDSDATAALYMDANVPSWAGSTLPNWSVTFDDAIIPAPSKPLNISGIISTGQITLSWTEPINNGGNSILDYIIEYKTTSSNSWIVLNDGVSSSTNTIITGILNGVTYDFRIYAVNSNNVSGLIGTASF
jgi:hypothetical protein